MMNLYTTETVQGFQTVTINQECFTELAKQIGLYLGWQLEQANSEKPHIKTLTSGKYSIDLVVNRKPNAKELIEPKITIRGILNLKLESGIVYLSSYISKSELEQTKLEFASNVATKTTFKISHEIKTKLLDQYQDLFDKGEEYYNQRKESKQEIDQLTLNFAEMINGKPIDSGRVEEPNNKLYEYVKVTNQDISLLLEMEVFKNYTNLKLSSLPLDLTHDILALFQKQLVDPFVKYSQQVEALIKYEADSDAMLNDLELADYDLREYFDKNMSVNKTVSNIIELHKVGKLNTLLTEQEEETSRQLKK